MIYEVLTWKLVMSRALSSIEHKKPRCPCCYKQYDNDDVDLLTLHLKRCYMARTLEHRMDTHDYTNKSIDQRHDMIEQVCIDVNLEISKYLNDLVDQQPELLL